MNSFEATFTEITNWQKNVHYSTGGTRSKYIALNPENNEEYFFKGSKETIEGEIRYPTEFWSEIVSSKIGQLLGFKMLDYNIAYDKNHKQKIGCLSKSMVDNSVNQLIEGKRYLTGFDEKYDSEKDKKHYTFQFIRQALIKSDFEYYINNIIEIIVFDSIIGNSDRHQENWGIIIDYSHIKNVTDNSLYNKNKGLTVYFKNFKKILKAELLTKEKKEMATDILINNVSSYFAPIYDSGCCLGREHEDAKVEKMIKDNQMLQSYIDKGKSEIHWETIGEKSKHFELVALLIQNYPNETTKFINRVKDNFDEKRIIEIIQDIDSNLPTDLINFKLSENRKILMSKLITLRMHKTLSLI